MRESKRWQLKFLGNYPLKTLPYIERKQNWYFKCTLTSLSVTVTGGGSVVGLRPLVLALAEEEECNGTGAGVEASAGIFLIWPLTLLLKDDWQDTTWLNKIRLSQQLFVSMRVTCKKKVHVWSTCRSGQAHCKSCILPWISISLCLSSCSCFSSCCCCLSFSSYNFSLKKKTGIIQAV